MDDQRVAALRKDAMGQIVEAMVPMVLEKLDELSNPALERFYRCIVTERWEEISLEPPREDDDPGYRAKLETRIRLVTSLEDREDQLAELRECARDPIYFINHWVWTLDPRQKGLNRLPMVLWDRQEEVIEFIMRHWEANESALIKKGRDVGLSVMVCALGVWFWLFRPGVVVAYGSRKEDLVHRQKDPNSLFEKIRMILRGLPDWMMPRGFKFHDHFNYMIVQNPENGATLVGEGGADLGRGGRSTLFLADEFSAVDHAQAAHAAITGNTDCCIFFGTSRGRDTYFYELEERGRYEVLRFPWYYDPRKVDDPLDAGNPAAASEWKDRKEEEVGPVIFAQEFACDDDQAVDNVVIPMEWVRAALSEKVQRFCGVKWAEGHWIELEPIRGVKVAGLDIADGGADDTVLAPRHGAVVQPLRSWGDLRARSMAPVIDRYASQLGTQFLYFDRSGVGQEFEGPIERVSGGSYLFHGVNGQDKASRFVVYEDDPRHFAIDRFANKVTELWWSLRRRFARTFEFFHTTNDDGIDPATGRPPFSPDELIVIPPDDDKLRRQLSSRTFMGVGGGKLQLTPKKKLRKSPDRADALALAEEKVLQMSQQTTQPATVVTTRGSTSMFDNDETSSW